MSTVHCNWVLYTAGGYSTLQVNTVHCRWILYTAGEDFRDPWCCSRARDNTIKYNTYNATRFLILCSLASCMAILGGCLVLWSSISVLKLQSGCCCHPGCWTPTFQFPFSQANYRPRLSSCSHLNWELFPPRLLAAPGCFLLGCLPPGWWVRSVRHFPHNFLVHGDLPTKADFQQ